MQVSGREVKLHGRPSRVRQTGEWGVSLSDVNVDRLPHIGTPVWVETRAGKSWIARVGRVRFVARDGRFAIFDSMRECFGVDGRGCPEVAFWVVDNVSHFCPECYQTLLDEKRVWQADESQSGSHYYAFDIQEHDVVLREAEDLRQEAYMNW